MICAGFYFFGWDNPTEHIRRGEFSQLKSSDRILIFAPHPDDETIATGGLIKKAKSINASVLVVSMTDGSASTNHTAYADFLSKNNLNISENLPELRNKELNEAASELGLSNNELISLGYPDAGLIHLFDKNWDTPYDSKSYFNNLNQSPYNFSYRQNVLYTGENVHNDLKSIISDFKPTIMVFPDSNDNLSDHMVTYAFVKQAAIETDYSGKNYTYLVHKEYSWPTPHIYFPWGQLKPSLSLQELDKDWIFFNLSSEEINAKDKALNKHKTQLNGNPNYLLSFIKTNELFMTHNQLVINNDSNLNKTPMMPNSSFSDVVGDGDVICSDGKLISQDLSKLGAYYDKNNLNIVLESKNNINKNLTYTFNIRKLNGNGNFTTMDFEFRNKTIIYNSENEDIVINISEDYESINSIKGYNDTNSTDNTNNANTNNNTINTNNINNTNINNINNYDNIMGTNDFKFLESVNLNVSGKFIILSIPLSEFKESSAIMLSSNVVGSKFIDKIDWREMYFPEDFNN
ncbi:MAG: PIG-L deacetylase family protein [Methanobacteriaceae archaeon]